MYRKLIVFVWVAVVFATTMLVPPQIAEATIGDITTTCRVYDKSGYTVSAANHANGLIYIAISDSDSGSADNLRNKARIVIRAIDPANAKSGGDCSSVQYFDSFTYTTYSVLVTPTVIRSDAAGNLYIGKITQGGYRLLYIPATAPKSTPFAGITATMITGVGGGPFVSMGGMAVTNNHVLMGAATFESGKKFYGYYRVITTTQAARGGSINGGWSLLSGFPLYGPQGSALDSFAGMSNGKFFIGGSFEYSNPKFMALGGILDPETNILTGIRGSSGKLDELPCTNATIQMFPYGCFYPSGQSGEDGNLYISYGVGQINGPRHNFVVRYNLSANRLENLNSVPNMATRITPFTGIDASGLGKYIDAEGNIYAAGTNGIKGPVTLAVYEYGSWTEKGFNIPITEFSKPAVIVSKFGSESRLSVFYVSLFDGDVYWTTYRGTFTTSTPTTSCAERIRFENGVAAIRSTTATGTISVNTACTANKYVVRVSNSATKPSDTPSSAEFRVYDAKNPIVSVAGLTANAINYIHVRMYDSTNKAVTEWNTTKIIPDTNQTIGATTTLTGQYSNPYYRDVLSSGGSSYANSAYTRSLIGKLIINNVTDLSGLASFQSLGSNEREFTKSMIDQEQSVFLQTTGVADQVGTTIRLTDEAGNIEDRNLTLIYDTTPPVATGAAITQTSRNNALFVRTFSVSGTITDNLYSGGYWGVWVAVEKDTGTADDTNPNLKWGAVPATSGAFTVNLLNGTSELVSSGDYRVYVRFLDGAGNASADGANVVVNVDSSIDTYKTFAPYITLQR